MIRACIYVIVTLLLAGCALDPMEQLAKDMASENCVARTQAVCELANLQDKRADEALLDLLERNPDCELADLAALALVKKGRDYERAGVDNPNPVIEGLVRILSNGHLAPACREHAAWALGEIGSRKALPALLDVGGEPAQQAREKLGYYSQGRAYEVPMGSLAGEVDLRGMGNRGRR